MKELITSLGITIEPYTASLLCLSTACVLLGFLVGRIFSKVGISRKIDDAVAKEKTKIEQDAAKEKAEISAQLGQELFKVRDSIVQSAKAYESTVRIIQERLQPGENMERFAIIGANQSQLALDLQENENNSDEIEKSINDDIEIEQDSQLEFEYTNS